MILGVATTVEAIHRSMPHSITSYLAIQKFSSAPSLQLLAKLIEEISTRIPIRIGGECLKLLLESFMFHDFSVNHFLTAYKVSRVLQMSSTDQIFYLGNSMISRLLLVLSKN